MIRGIIITICFLHLRQVVGDLVIMQDYFYAKELTDKQSDLDHNIWQAKKHLREIAKHYADILDDEYGYTVDVS